MSFPIVGIGASAGGLEALAELLSALPAQNGLAIIVVFHLDPDRESHLLEVLAKKTAVRVREAEDGLAIEPDNLYLIPRNATLTAVNGHLKLTKRPAPPTRHLPVDALFRSLAQSHPHRSVSIVLSGGDADGSLGSRAVKQEGGITFAQEPSSARVPSMPLSAIDTECIDFVLRPNQIASELLRLARHPRLHSVPSERQPVDIPEGVEAVDFDELSLRRIFRRLRAAHGVDFTHYKRSTLRRRLMRRMALQRIDSLADYVALIEGDVTEAATLHQDFLIRVTGFFRDPESFDVLRETIFPLLCEGRSAKEPIRIWVPGCATGEEVYSIAISLVEYFGDRSLPQGIQIFGTDVSESAIEKARAGYYLHSITDEVSAERLNRFFARHDGHYRIAKSIRELCIFARQDVTRDPPFSRLSLVSCRNLLIYLDATAQRRVMQIFHYSLLPRGFLLLGSSESVGQASDLFELTDKQHRVYTRKSAPPSIAFHGTRPAGPYARPRDAEEDDTPALLDTESAEREADRLLLARFAPASVLIDDSLNILQFRGETARYLEHASGTSSLKLNRVMRPELLVEIAPAIQEARTTGSEARRDGISVADVSNVNVQIIPLIRVSSEHCYLIVFDNGAPLSARRESAPVVALTESEKDRRLAQAEREILAMRDYLAATMEEHEAVREELKSAHEEVLSANEEFQSTNEELETAKEELQSANEELTTTNDELRDRNRELARLNAEIERARRHSDRARAYADAIIEAVREPLAVLDSNFILLRANRSFFSDFHVSAADVERQPFFQLGHGQWDAEEVRDALDAVRTKTEQTTSTEVSKVFPLLGKRTMRLTARSIPGSAERDELILVSIEDVTEPR